jgi:hypothetical protein
MPYKDLEKRKACWTRYQKTEKSKATKRAWMEKTPEKQARYRQDQRNRQKADPEKYRTYFRNHRIKKTYGITQEQYEQMLKDQGGVCAICGRLPNGSNHVEQSLVIDHCHTTNKVRGLLCNNCNSGMGMIGDTVEHLEAAIEYLKKF